MDHSKFVSLQTKANDLIHSFGPLEAKKKTIDIFTQHLKDLRSIDILNDSEAFEECVDMITDDTAILKCIIKSEEKRE